ncbi:Calcium-channel protein cch1 [Cyphellophora attinorum]|uniref:Calcium-channel protein CCH1 n=1 Tax=Cyphellophora attinorum TaxID=1664694 RepID=A0A0N0NPI1_9EURO|nr:Calcium-channel protein cch1 [Phialophora attinorum]KPI42569.1 Calcium-channel protein cch1 [Phialophora attinorum]
MADGHDRTPPRHRVPQSIPLRNLSRPPDDESHGGHKPRHSRGRSILSGLNPTSDYARLEEDDSPVGGLSPSRGARDFDDRPSSGEITPLDDLGGFAAASVGLSLGPPALGGLRPSTPPSGLRRPTITTTGADEDNEQPFSPPDTDTTPLTTDSRRRIGSRSLDHTNSGQRHDRQNKRSSVHWVDGAASLTPERGRTSRLGDDLPSLDTGGGVARKMSSSSVKRSRSNTVAAGSGDGVEADVESAVHGTSPLEKTPSAEVLPPPPPPTIYENPLRGKSFGIFGPENGLRKALCELLIHPLTEPIILVLIVIQTVMLAVNAAADAVYHQSRGDAWGTSKFDYGILGLFIIYTIEAVARSIVSNFLMNPYEYSTLDRSLGFRKAVVDKAQGLFAPHTKQAPKAPVQPTEQVFQPSIVRTFTGLPEVKAIGPGHSKHKQRLRLARRAFLRHSFNRLDLIAVVSYWISLSMQLSGYEAREHVYIFNMLSSLRILRLLGLTAGTSIILRSLKKAAPLLVHVAFLISFFWLIFGIVGVQSFKSSFRRTCVWVGDDGSGQNYTQNLAPENIQFCGGYLNATTAAEMPWLKSDGSNGTSHPKGFICPIGSLCVENFEGPYNGTIGFDNIYHSLEMAFVIMSSNTFSDLMYYLTDSDYLSASLYFMAGIVVLSFWLVGLLIAVITSSFQIIREESKRSAFDATPMDEPVIDEENAPRVSQLKKLYDKTHLFWIAVITFDLVVQSLRSASMGPSREHFIMNTETAVTFLLVVEIIIRFASDWRHFFSSKRNWTDLFLAVVTLVMQIPPIRNSGQVYAWMSAFQIARIYRVVLAVRVTRELLMIVFGNTGGLFNLIIFVFLFTFLAAILGSQLFRGDIPAEDAGGNNILVEFFDIWNSFIGMYQIFSSENWTEPLYNVQQFNKMYMTGWLGAMFFVLWFIIANFIILNMFIAVIQESFDVSEDEKRLQQVKAFLKQKEVTGSSNANLSLSSIFKMGRDSMRHRDALQYGSAAVEQLLKEAVVKDFLDERDEPDPLSRRPTSMHLSSIPTVGANVKPGMFSKYWGKLLGRSNHEPNPFYSSTSTDRANEEFDPRSVAQQLVANADQRRRAQRQYLIKHPKYNVSLFIFGPRNPIRRACQFVVGPGRGEERIEGVAPYKPVWYGVGAFTYACIVAMVVLACITTPLYQRTYWETHPRSITNWFVWPDLGFAVIFTAEAIIKVIADGFLFTPHAYYRTVWGVIDAVVVITLWINVLTTIFQDDGVSRAVGAFKALRALRLLNISDTARRTFHSVIVGGYKVLAAAFVTMSLLVPFAILGLNLFNGKMDLCNDQSFSGNLTNCIGEFNSTPFNWPVLAPRQVANPYYDFDDFGSSLFVLFQIASQEGWTDVMGSAMSITGKGLQYEYFASQGNAVYFIVFNLLGAVFVLTLFISVFMRNYTEQTGVAFLTAEQRSWLELRKLLKQISPTKRSVGENSKGLRRVCYNLSIKKRGKWQRFITSLLLLHLCILLVEFYPEPAWWDQTREYIFLVFTLILVANIVIRIIGLSWTRFRRSTWDLYSLVSVTGCLATSIMRVITEDIREIDMLHKLFMVSLVFLLIPRNNQLDQLLKTAAASFPLIANLLATWFVLFLVYAIAFTQTFSLTRFGSTTTTNINFRDVPKALILLFRCSIGEGWNQVMEDFATIEPPYCVQDDDFYNSDCGSASWARALFVSWNIISMYIFVSLFVSLIFESFSYVYQRSSGLQVITRDEIRRFKQAWAEFDPRGRGYIPKEKFPRLLGELSGVFQMRIYDGDFTIRALMEDCRVEPGDIHKRRRVVDGIDLDLLNARLSHIPLEDIRMKKQQMEVFYQEVMLSADPDLGINFTSTLMILAHYNIIEDSRSLRLEEFLRRRARLQRVHESIRRNIVVGFFDTMFWSRRFREAIAHKRNSRMGAPPSMPVPEIIVDEMEDGSSATEPTDFLHPSSAARPTSPMTSPRLPRIDTSMASAWARDSPSRSSFDIFPTGDRISPVRENRPRLHSVDTSYSGGVEGRTSPARTPPRTPTTTGGTPSHSRNNSNVGDAGVMESFDNSAWGESIRRGLTRKRSQK